MRALGARGINELHVEAGGKLNGALLAAGLVDELLLYLAPCLLGDPARGIAEFRTASPRLSDRVALTLHDVARVGDDLRVLARVVRDGGLMFTGIVQAVGRIAATEPKGDGLRIAVDIGMPRCRGRRGGRQHRRQRLLPDDRRGQRLDAGFRRVRGNACAARPGSIAWATSTSRWRCAWPTAWAGT